MQDFALLIIDMQKDFCDKGSPLYVNGSEKIIPNIKNLINAFKKCGAPVIFVARTHKSDGSDLEITRFPVYLQFRRIYGRGPLEEGTDGMKFVEGLEPQKGDYVVYKKRWSAFFNTELDLLLRVLSVTKLVLAGVQTPNCIRATAYDAIALNYEVIVVSDATQASNQLVHEINLKDMENIGIGIMDTKSIIENLPNLPFKDLLGKLKEYLTGS
jgi:nicotinamidase-related amidase